MPIYEIWEKPTIDEGAWIAPGAEIIGDVKIGKNCYIGFGAIIRGDFASIIIGDETAVEENVVIHAANQTKIGNQVIIGHRAMIHNATINDGTLIGMKSMICDDTIIGEDAIVAEQSLVQKNQIVPLGVVYAGSPARAIKNTQRRHKEFLIT